MADSIDKKGVMPPGFSRMVRAKLFVSKVFVTALEIVHANEIIVGQTKNPIYTRVIGSKSTQHLLNTAKNE